METPALLEAPVGQGGAGVANGSFDIDFRAPGHGPVPTHPRGGAAHDAKVGRGAVLCLSPGGGALLREQAEAWFRSVAAGGPVDRSRPQDATRRSRRADLAMARYPGSLCVPGRTLQSRRQPARGRQYLEGASSPRRELTPPRRYHRVATSARRAARAPSRMAATTTLCYPSPRFCAPEASS